MIKGIFCTVGTAIIVMTILAYTVGGHKKSVGKKKKKNWKKNYTKSSSSYEK